VDQQDKGSFCECVLLRVLFFFVICWCPFLAEVTAAKICMDFLRPVKYRSVEGSFGLELFNCCTRITSSVK